MYMQAVHTQLSASRTFALSVRAQAEEVQQDDGGSRDASSLALQFGGTPNLHLSWQKLYRGQGALKFSPVAQKGLKSREYSLSSHPAWSPPEAVL